MQPPELRSYKDCKWIVADPRLLGGGLAIRGTRLSVALILECLANGMTLADIDESFDGAFPQEAMPEVLRVASELVAAAHPHFASLARTRISSTTASDSR